MTVHVAEVAATPEVSPRQAVRGLVTALRPRQWVKNLLVVAAPLSAGALREPHVLAATAIAVVAFCLAASATYLVNDVVDVEADRAHPVKRNRPIAAGALSVRSAVIAAVTLATVAVVLAVSVTPALGLVTATYIAATLSYSLRLKHEPVLELMLLAGGFLLRAIAGGVATGVPLSGWFLVVAGFASLFAAAGKRAAELQRLSAADPGSVEASGGRAALRGYTLSYLRFVWQLSAGVTVVAYCLWAFQVADRPSSQPWVLLSIVPLLLALLRYAARVDRGEAEAPEDTLLGDHVLLVSALAWAVLFSLGAFGV